MFKPDVPQCHFLPYTLMFWWSLTGSTTPHLAAVALILACRSIADACSCMAPPPPKVALEGSSAVFSGKCVKIEVKEFNKVCTFEVD